MSTPMSQSFNGGEISELMSARPDQQRFQSGCKTLKNMVCLPQGPATRRPGFRFLDAVKETTLANDVILVPFVFSTRESRVLEFGHNYIRVWKGDDLIESAPSTPLEVVTTYTAAELRDLRFAQSADIVYIASPTHKPAKLSRFSDTNWGLADINFIPETEVPTGLSVANTTGVASSGKQTYKYVITAISNVDGEESLASSVVSITTDILNKTDGNYNDITWSANSVAPLEYRVYKYEAGIYGYIGTAAHPAVTFRDDNIGADEDDTPPNGENPFTAAGDYPALVFFWQQRLGWAATDNKPFTVWLSPSAQFESLAASQPPADDDAIEKTLAATQANRIQWIAGDRSLVLGTTGNEWSMGGTDGEVLTPATGGFFRQGGKGSEDTPALTTGDALLYVQRGGDIVREFAYSYNVDRYESPDASIISSHLLDARKVVNWCYQNIPYSIVWIVMDDGALISLTYVREHQVIGWHRHETSGVVEDVCAVPGSGGYDLVYAVIRRTINGSEVRYVERMDNYFIRVEDPAEAFFVDSGASYSGAATTTLTGLAAHLVGETVKIWADGAERPEQVVPAGGTIELAKEAEEVSLGLGFESVLVPTRPEVVAPEGTSLTRVEKVSTANIKLFRSMGVKAGASIDELEEILKHDASDPLPPAYVTRAEEVAVDTGWEEDWNFTIMTDGPGPMTVLAAVYDVEIGEML
ncbi:MAG: hypothetical protein GY753_11990 [Gammaproteobacteria bacterium]|nr:hypothetical protein [Gammaproteobacteria bacterium]